MDGSKSREALAAFLTYLADKGLMQNNTVQARKAAVSKRSSGSSTLTKRRTSP